MAPEPVVQFGPTNPNEVHVKSVAISEANPYLVRKNKKKFENS